MLDEEICGDAVAIPVQGNIGGKPEALTGGIKADAAIGYLNLVVVSGIIEGRLAGQAHG